MNVKRGKKVRGMESKRGREGTRDRAIYGSLCHSGFILAARFDGGKGGRARRPWGQTTPRCKGEAMRGQAGLFWRQGFL